MTSLTGNYNVLLGRSAVLPNPASNHQIAIGANGDSIYLGGSGMVTISSYLNQPSTLTVPKITLSGVIGTNCQQLVSGGAGTPPLWSLDSQTIVNSTSLTPPLAPLYLLNAPNLTITLPLANTIGTTFTIKSINTVSGIIRSNSIINLHAITPSGTGILMTTGDSGLFSSDGTYWYILSSNKTFPVIST